MNIFTYPTYLTQPARGFSLAETLIVISIMGILANLTLSAGADTFARNLSQIDRGIVVSALREARAESMNDVCLEQNCSAPVAHGVFFESGKVTIFEGPSYAARYARGDTVIPFFASESISVSSSTSQIMFTPGSGNSSSTTISITSKNSRTQTIQVLGQGGIFVTS